jgi:hypothetical protein
MKLMPRVNRLPGVTWMRLVGVTGAMQCHAP